MLIIDYNVCLNKFIAIIIWIKLGLQLIQDLSTKYFTKFQCPLAYFYGLVFQTRVKF